MRTGQEDASASEGRLLLPRDVPRGVRPVRLLRVACCMLLIVLGIAVVFGWIFEIEAMKSVAPGHATMKFNTAIAFILIGFGLAGAGSERSTVQQVAALCGAISALIGLLTLVEYLAGANLGIDEMIVRDTGTLRGSGYPGRMSPLTAGSYVALGSAIMLLAGGRDRRPIIVAHFLAAVAGFTAFLAAAGYAFGAEAFWGIGFYTAIAIHTAFGLILAVAATLMTRADEGWLSTFWDSPDARALLASLLPISFLLPTMLGLLLLFGSGLGAYNAAFGFALFVPCMIFGLVAVTLRVALRAREAELALRGGDAALRESEERLSTVLDTAQLGTFDWDLQSDVIQLDSRARTIFGAPDIGQVRGSDLFDRVHPADLQRVLAEVRASRDYSTRLELEYRMLLPDGTTRTLLSFSNVAGTTRRNGFSGLSAIFRSASGWRRIFASSTRRWRKGSGNDRRSSNGCMSSCGRRRSWRRWASSLVASHTTSTTCSARSSEASTSSSGAAIWMTAPSGLSEARLPRPSGRRRSFSASWPSPGVSRCGDPLSISARFCRACRT